MASRRYVGRHRRPRRPCPETRGYTAFRPCLLSRGHRGGHLVPFGPTTLRLGTRGVFERR